MFEILITKIICANDVTYFNVVLKTLSLPDSYKNIRKLVINLQCKLSDMVLSIVDRSNFTCVARHVNTLPSCSMSGVHRSIDIVSFRSSEL